MSSTINFYGASIEWRLRDPEKPLYSKNVEQKASDEWVSANSFMMVTYTQSSRYCTGKERCKNINTTLSTTVEDDEYHFSKYYSASKKVWNAVCDIIKKNSNNEKKLPENSEEVEISASFADHIFCPLIPDSPMVNWSHDESSPLKRSFGLFGLFFETPVRLLMVFGGHALLSCYSLVTHDEKSADYIAYYRFRLDINSYYPLQEIIWKLI